MGAVIGYVGLGSNLGDRRERLRFALRALEDHGLEVGAVSSVWETEPVDCVDCRWFLNMVVGIAVRRPPLAVLDALLAVERRAGRERGEPNAPRTLDLDLLLLGDLRVELPRLTLPHPRMWARPFVLAPLEEIAPGLRNPGTGRTVREELAGLDGGGRVIRRGPLARHRALPV